MDRATRRGILLALSLSVALVPALRADAQVSIYHSVLDDGLPPSMTPIVPVAAQHTINLFAEGTGLASSTGTVCEDANGGEICAVDFVILGVDGVRLSSFMPESDVVYDLDTEADRLRLNQISAISGWAGPVRLGSLEIDTLGATLDVSVVVMSAGVVVDAGLRTLDAVPSTIARVPEPTTALGIAAGSLWLGLLHEARRRRA